MSFHKNISGDSSLGFVSIKTNLTDSKDSLLVGCDHMWLKNGLDVEKETSGARKVGPKTIGQIGNGEEIFIDVPTGSHVLSAWNDFYSSEPLTIEVARGETVHVLCGDNFSGISRLYHSIRYCFRPPTPGKYFYSLCKL